jgi:hypothetical protein
MFRLGISSPRLPGLNPGGPVRGTIPNSSGTELVLVNYNQKDGNGQGNDDMQPMFGNECYTRGKEEGSGLLEI